MWSVARDVHIASKQSCTGYLIQSFTPTSLPTQCHVCWHNLGAEGRAKGCQNRSFLRQHNDSMSHFSTLAHVTIITSCSSSSANPSPAPYQPPCTHTIPPAASFSVRNYCSSTPCTTTLESVVTNSHRSITQTQQKC